MISEATAAGIEPHEARRIGEEASGDDGATWTVTLREQAGLLAVDRFRAMVERRLTGEPLQYVLGRWGFRRLDLLVDRRVLIPRPETEWVVEQALTLLPVEGAAGEAGEVGNAVVGNAVIGDAVIGDAVVGDAVVGNAVVVDLGTGSGAIGLAIADERWPRVRVVLTDASTDALAVARANLAGLGRRGTNVELHEGSWWDALPAGLRGEVDLVVSNPPYVAPAEPLPAEVADWEPVDALIPGPTGLEALEAIIGEAATWLRPGGWIVCEIGETQGDATLGLAAEAGLVDAEVRPDLTGRPRMVLARRPD